MTWSVGGWMSISDDYVAGFNTRMADNDGHGPVLTSAQFLSKHAALADNIGLVCVLLIMKICIARQ